MPRITKATVPAQTAGSEQGVPRNQIRDKVLKYIESQPGLTVYLSDMEGDLKAQRSTIQSAVRGLQERLPNIETVVTGKAWRYVVRPNSGKRIFEELTTTKAGIILVQDEDGNVYKLEEL